MTDICYYVGDFAFKCLVKRPWIKIYTARFSEPRMPFGDSLFIRKNTKATIKTFYSIPFSFIIFQKENKTFRKTKERSKKNNDERQWRHFNRYTWQLTYIPLLYTAGNFRHNTAVMVGSKALSSEPPQRLFNCFSGPSNVPLEGLLFWRNMKRNLKTFFLKSEAPEHVT